MSTFFRAALTVLFLSVGYTSAYAAPASVVQVVSYDDVYLSEPTMQGWGSASVIDNRWTLLSNNHVVVDEKGNLVSALAICVSEGLGSRPLCKYTADVIAHDDKIDLSVLRIRPTDIFGKAVDYSQFKPLEVDYSYVPKTQDDVIAIGFPWIGADTITETKGIVSGISEYNDFTYIKTDTSIAGGNSGGAFIRNGKLIGVPTFGIGGFGENSLGYALLISEGKDFIEKNRIKSVEASTALLDIVPLLKRIANAKSSGVFDDGTFRIKLPTGYTITDSSIGKNVTLSKEQNGDITASITISRSGIPVNVGSGQIDFERLLSKLNGFSREYYRLTPVKIGGYDFYQMRGKNAGDRETSSYYGRTSANSYISIVPNIYADEKTPASTIQALEKELIATISFDTSISQDRPVNLDIKSPLLQVSPQKNAISTKGYYYGNTQITVYLASQLAPMREIVIAAEKKYDYSGSGIEADLDTDYLYQGTSPQFRGKVSFGEKSGYYYCNQSPQSSTDALTTKSYQSRSCGIVLSQGVTWKRDNENFVLRFTLNTNDLTVADDFDTLLQFLKANVTLDTKAVDLSVKNPFKKVTGTFEDLANQSSDYRDRMNILTTWGLIQARPTLDPYTPVTWGEYIDLSLRFLYGLDSRLATTKCGNDYLCRFGQIRLPTGANHSSERTVAELIKPLNIALKWYVPSDATLLSAFDIRFALMLAEHSPTKTTYQAITDITNRLSGRTSSYNYSSAVNTLATTSGLSEESLASAARAIDSWRDLYYGKDPQSYNYGASPLPGASFSATKSVILLPNGKISTVENPYYQLEPSFIGAKIFSDASDKWGCEYARGSIVSYTYCLNTLKVSKGVELLTRATALDLLSNQMDIGLFDLEKRAKRDGGNFMKYITVKPPITKKPTITPQKKTLMKKVNGIECVWNAANWSASGTVICK